MHESNELKERASRNMNKMQKLMMRGVLSLAVAGTPLSVWAEVADMFELQFRNESKICIPVASRPELIPEQEYVTVRCSDMEVSYRWGEIARMGFTTDEVTGVHRPQSAGEGELQYERPMLLLQGFAAGTAVNIYDISGQAVYHGVVGSSGSMSISLAEFAPGTYVVQAGQNSIKVRV